MKKVLALLLGVLGFLLAARPSSAFTIQVSNSWTQNADFRVFPTTSAGSYEILEVPAGASGGASFAYNYVGSGRDYKLPDDGLVSVHFRLHGAVVNLPANTDQRSVLLITQTNATTGTAVWSSSPGTLASSEYYTSHRLSDFMEYFMYGFGIVALWEVAGMGRRMLKSAGDGRYGGDV